MNFVLDGGSTSVYNWFIDNFMAENPTFSVVYIYTLRLLSEGKECSNKIIADKLNILESDVVKAWKYWEKKSVVRIEDDRVIILNSVRSDTDNNTDNSDKTKKKPKRKFYSPEIIDDLIKNDKDLNDLLKTVERIVGRTLSPNNADIVTYMYDFLQLPFGVIVTLVNYYHSKEKNLPYMEKVAISWAERGINTIEKAEKEVDSFNDYYKILKFFGVTNRGYTEKERKYMEVWLGEYNFTMDIIKIACERAAEYTGRVSFSYANTVLENWHNMNVKSVEDIDKLDSEAKTKATKTKTVHKPVKNVFTNFQQRKYTEEEIKKIIKRKAEG